MILTQYFLALSPKSCCLPSVFFFLFFRGPNISREDESLIWKSYGRRLVFVSVGVFSTLFICLPVHLWLYYILYLMKMVPSAFSVDKFVTQVCSIWATCSTIYAFSNTERGVQHVSVCSQLLQFAFLLDAVLTLTE